MKLNRTLFTYLPILLISFPFKNPWLMLCHIDQLKLKVLSLNCDNSEEKFPEVNLPKRRIIS